MGRQVVKDVDRRTSLRMLAAPIYTVISIRAQGVPVETHLFAHGGHGFGLRYTVGKPTAAWPDLFVNWSQSMGLT